MNNVWGWKKNIYEKKKNIPAAKQVLLENVMLVQYTYIHKCTLNIYKTFFQEGVCAGRGEMTKR